MTEKKLRSADDIGLLKKRADEMRKSVEGTPLHHIEDRTGIRRGASHDTPYKISSVEEQISVRNRTLRDLGGILLKIKIHDREYTLSQISWFQSEIESLYDYLDKNPMDAFVDRKTTYKTRYGMAELILATIEQQKRAFSGFNKDYSDLVELSRNIESETAVKNTDKRGNVELSLAEQKRFNRYGILDPIWTYEEYLRDELPAPADFDESMASPHPNIWFPDQLIPSKNDEKAYFDFWHREWQRCCKGIWIGGGQIYISGWLYSHTTCATAEIDHPSGGKQPSLLLLRDTEWEIDEKKTQARAQRKGVITFGSRDSGKTYGLSSLGAWHYTFFRNSQIGYSAAQEDAMTTLTNTTESILTNYPSEFRYQRQEDNSWDKGLVRASLKNPDGTKNKNSWDSRFIVTNYNKGKNTAANKNLRPVFHVNEEAGRNPTAIRCHQQSKACWNFKQGALPWYIGTGGDMGEGADAINMFKQPDVYNLISHFIPVTRALHAYKDEWTLYDFLTKKRGMKLEHHPDLEVTILVSNEQRCLEEFVYPQRTLQELSTEPNALAIEKANYPLTPEEMMMTNTHNPFPVEMCKQQRDFLIKNEIFGQAVELDRDLNGKVIWKTTHLQPIRTFPTPKDLPDKTGCVVIYEFPEKNAPWGTYVGGIDPYKQDTAVYSTSLGSVYIYKRTIDVINGTYQDTMVAQYVGRPATIHDWNKIAEMLLEFYNAISNGENEDTGFINHMITQHKSHYLAECMDFLREIVPKTKVARPYWLTGQDKPKKFCRNELISYCTEIIGRMVIGQDENQKPIFQNVYGISRIYDIALLQEMIDFTADGNFDRIIGFSYGVAYARQYMDRHMKTPPKKPKTVEKKLTPEEERALMIETARSQMIKQMEEKQRKIARRAKTSSTVGLLTGRRKKYF